MSVREPSKLLRANYISAHSIRDRNMANGGAGGVPSLHIVLGVDKDSAGMCAIALTPSGGRYESQQALIAQRWKQHPQTVSELMWIAYRGIEEWLRENGEIPEVLG